MSINLYNIKKWYKMLTGTSIEHVNQGKGRCYSKDEIKGYYNDLTEKVKKEQILDNNGIPLLNVDNGDKIYFPIMIFQYGLGAYDKYLISNKKDKEMLKKLISCAEWALQNQELNGGWKNFEYEYPENPYSSMAQGEGISLLIRAYLETQNLNYKKAAKKAANFMILDIKYGGTTEYHDGKIYLHEFTHLPTVLNGWIFSLFGLFDYILLTNDKEIGKLYKDSIFTLEKEICKFDNGYWSMYNFDKMITSPFYHKLHIAQLEVLYDLTGIKTFKEYAMKWTKYLNKRYNRNKAFFVKVLQKILE